MLPSLRSYAMSEKEEALATLAVQVSFLLSGEPQAKRLDDTIEKILITAGITGIGQDMWPDLENRWHSGICLKVLNKLAGTIPVESLKFIEHCLGHPDPQVRACACEPALASKDPSLAALTFAMVTDSDEGTAMSAFSTIRAVPPGDMSAILRETFRSGDHWVKDTVAEFLPLIASDDLREILLELSGHCDQKVVQKSREALTRIDKAAAERENNRTVPALQSATSAMKSVPVPLRVDLPAYEKKPDRVISAKTKLAESKEKQISDTVEIVNAPADESEIQPPGEPGSNDTISESTKSPIASLSADLSTSESKQAVAENQAADPSAAEVTISPDEPVISKQAPAAETVVSEPIKTGESESQTEKPLEITIQAENAAIAQTEEKPESTQPEVDEQAILKGIPETQPDISEESGDSKERKQPAGLAVTAPQQPLSGVQDIKEMLSDVEITIVSENDTAQKSNERQLGEVGKATGAPPVSISVNPAMKAIMQRYPSFISSQISKLASSQAAATHLDTLQTAFKALAGFLNLTFAQSYLFYITRSPRIDKVVKDCLKEHLSGPSCIRHLHNLSLAIKANARNDDFFTFPLAGLLSEAGDDNPLVSMRELGEYLDNPIEPLEESIVMAIDGFVNILVSMKIILQNKIVMKTPQGSKTPYADLSGPTAKALSESERPSLDLPSKEIVVLSKDGSEALGLFPYFAYIDKAIRFTEPKPELVRILCDRLELDISDE